MTTVPPSSALAALRWRYAVKKFDSSKKIAPDVWSALEEALILSPSSYGLQPWKFFVVESPEVRQKLLPASWGQKQIVDASHLVVLSVKKDVGPTDAEKLVARSAEIRGIPTAALEGYKGMMIGSLTRSTAAEVDIWMSRQIFIALGVLLTTAAFLGVDACPMEGFENAKYDEILGLGAKGYASRVVTTLGYRAADDPYASLAKVRYPVEEVIERI